jgi:hypothetical protein
MNERNYTAWAVALGAAVGGAVAYLFFTEGGRRLREQVEPRVADLLGELEKWGAVDQLKRMAFFAPAGASPPDWAGEADESLH